MWVFSLLFAKITRAIMENRVSSERGSSRRKSEGYGFESHTLFSFCFIKTHYNIEFPYVGDNKRW